jgi:hypothetical protein
VNVNSKIPTCPEIKASNNHYVNFGEVVGVLGSNNNRNNKDNYIESVRERQLQSAMSLTAPAVFNIQQYRAEINGHKERGKYNSTKQAIQ